MILRSINNLMGESFKQFEEERILYRTGKKRKRKTKSINDWMEITE